MGKVRERNFLHYLLFVTYFPHLIAGPIIHHKQLMPQFANPDTYRMNPVKIANGLAIFTLGLSKKMLLADPLGSYATLLFDGVSNGAVNPKFFLSWYGALAYAFQVYFDFSGYSDMAVGLALMFGVLLPINFNAPYRATSIIDFWQRWHISLTHYVWEYLYTPLTMAFVRRSVGKSKTAQLFYTLIFPTVIAFVVIGFWHGANWTYILFGAMHAGFIIVNRLWRKWGKMHALMPLHFLSSNYAGWLLTFICVVISVVIFRADSVQSAATIYKGNLNILQLKL